MSILSTCLKEILSGKKVIFFGTGQFSKNEIEILSERIAYFCDNNPIRIGSTFYGKHIYGIDHLIQEDLDNTVIVINTEFYHEIAKQLFERRFIHIYSKMYCNGNKPVSADAIKLSDNFLVRKYHALRKYDLQKCSQLLSDEDSRILFNNIIEKYKTGCFDFSDLMSHQPIYFNDIFRSVLSEQEVYVDCGVYNGKTVLDFALYAGGKYDKIYAFEPDVINFFTITHDFIDFPNVELLNYAVADRNGEVYFDNRGTQSSHIVENPLSGGQNINAVKLDDICKIAPTFIKMDIEGGEYNALLGARSIIEQTKPKLAISAYHCEDDLCRLLYLIREMREDYKFYLLHHSPLYVDTVLYAL